MPICKRCGMASLDGESHECPHRSDIRIAWCLAGAIIAPIVPIAYLNVSVGEQSADIWVVMLTGVGVGAAALGQLPTSRLLRIALMGVYVPVTVWMQFLYLLGFACGHYWQCL